MTKYRKKPVVIEAEQYRQGLEDGFEEMNLVIGTGWTPENGDTVKTVGTRKVPYIETLEGRHYISEGDFIITGIKGERYPCKPDIFEATYEKVL